MNCIHVIHENAAWLEPLAAALNRQGLPWHDWFLDHGAFDLSRPPPEGVFYNRMSASSHTRGHRYAAELTVAVLAWLERHGRRVVNGSRALDLEISKARQYAALEAAGIRTPDTVPPAKDLLVEAAREFRAAVHPQAEPRRQGARRAAVSVGGCARRSSRQPGFEPPVDGLPLLQQYIRAPLPLITRAEFVGGRFMYAVEVDTSLGFELCPADVCEVGDAFCPAGERAARQIRDHRRDRIRRKVRYEAFLAANAIGVAGIEFITDAKARSTPTTSTPTPTTTPTLKLAPAVPAWTLSPAISAPNSPSFPLLASDGVSRHPASYRHASLDPRSLGPTCEDRSARKDMRYAGRAIQGLSKETVILLQKPGAIILLDADRRKL